MKKLLLLALLPLCAAGLRAEDTKPETTKPAKGGEDLHGLMKKIAKDFGPLAKSVDDVAKIDANRKLAKELAELADKCAALVPASATKVPAADREKFVEGYKAEIAKLSEAFKKIDAALEKKDFAAAKAAVVEAGALKKEDHPKYIKKK